jgi:hypothetical protein
MHGTHDTLGLAKTVAQYKLQHGARGTSSDFGQSFQTAQVSLAQAWIGDRHGIS